MADSLSEAWVPVLGLVGEVTILLGVTSPNILFDFVNYCELTF